MRTIGRYRLIQRIGAGSFATVHRGHDDELDVPVAVKVLGSEWIDHGDVRSRFLAEARYLRRIRDERVIRVYDIGTTPENLPFFVMDYADGGSFEVLRRNLIQPGRALRLCAEAARALEVLHRHHVLHRDVTPGNILLNHTAGGLRVLLADLGVAESLINEQTVFTTAGTPAFMALEQAQGGALDERADVYSMAAVTYALLTGHAPFPIRNVPDLLQRNPAVGPPLIAQHLGAPPALDNLLTDALSPYVDQRPASAALLATALDDIADVLPGGDTFTPRPLPIEAPRSPSSLIESASAASAASLPPAHSTVLHTGGSFHAVPVSAPARQPAAATGPAGGVSMVTHRNETPVSMLDNYLGPGRYRPQELPERHTPAFYLWATVAVVIVFLLTAALTVLWLAR